MHRLTLLLPFLCIAAALYIGAVLGASAIRDWGSTKSGVTGTVACTDEAYICPDGTAVGRTGPTCQFAPCPTGNANANSSADEPVFCTADALACPDGSFVGRIPPDCEFAACPGQ